MNSAYVFFLFVRNFARMCKLMFIRISPFRCSPVELTVESNPESLNSSGVVFRDNSGFSFSILKTLDVIFNTFCFSIFCFENQFIKQIFDRALTPAPFHDARNETWILNIKMGENLFLKKQRAIKSQIKVMTGRFGLTLTTPLILVTGRTAPGSQSALFVLYPLQLKLRWIIINLLLLTIVIKDP